MPLLERTLHVFHRVFAPRARWWAVAIGLTLLFLNVWAHAKVDRIQLSLDAETKRQRHLQSRIHFLGNEVRRGSSLSEVERRAVGMTTPAPETITVLHLEPGEDGRTTWDVIVSEAHAASPGDGEGR
jgi:hypothetical protein